MPPPPPSRPTYLMGGSPSLTSQDDSTHVEDSMRGAAPTRNAALPTLSRQDAYALLTTPDATAPPAFVSRAQRMTVPTSPVANAASGSATPLVQPNHLAAQPPRIERVQAQTLFTRPAEGAAFARPMQMDESMDASASASASFAFPRIQRAAGMPAVSTTAHAHGGLFASTLASHRAAEATAPTQGYPHPTSPSNSSLDMAALAAERRIREQRQASRTAVVPGRVVSFSTSNTPAMTTPVTTAAPPPLPGRMPTAAAHRGGGGDPSFSHLAAGGRGGYGDLSLSLSTDAPLPARRLFASPTLPPNSSASFFAHPTTPHRAVDESNPLTEEPSSTSLHHPDQIETVALRKWDGTSVTLPAYLVSDQPESAVQEVFHYDAVHRFDINALTSAHDAAGSGTATVEEKKGEAEDALLGILEVQVGLRGLHGWYGHTYVNSSHNKEGEGRRKRRRSSSSSSHSSSSSSSGSSPIIVYDSFGRVRGTVTLPSYTSRGGPSFPLPPPRETFALRHAATAQLVLTATNRLVEKESQLAKQVEQRGRGGAREVRSHKRALAAFQAKHRGALRKGLQNALLDSALLTPGSLP